MNTTTSTKMSVPARRKRIKDLAFKGKTRAMIQSELGLPYQTVRLDLKKLGIIPAPANNVKENA